MLLTIALFHSLQINLRMTPKAFLQSTPVPELPWEVVAPSPPQPGHARRLELYDIFTGPFPLDLAAELNYFLEDFSEELNRALNAPGVECRNLHLNDEPKPGVTSEFSFSNEQLKAVLKFGWDVHFATSGADAKDWTAGSRILHR